MRRSQWVAARGTRLERALDPCPRQPARAALGVLLPSPAREAFPAGGDRYQHSSQHPGRLVPFPPGGAAATADGSAVVCGPDSSGEAALGSLRRSSYAAGRPMAAGPSVAGWEGISRCRQSRRTRHYRTAVAVPALLIDGIASLSGGLLGAASAVPRRVPWAGGTVRAARVGRCNDRSRYCGSRDPRGLPLAVADTVQEARRWLLEYGSRATGTSPSRLLEAL